MSELAASKPETTEYNNNDNDVSYTRYSIIFGNNILRGRRGNEIRFYKVYIESILRRYWLLLNIRS